MNVTKVVKYNNLCLLCRLEVWPGFVTSIMKLQNNVMLIADLSHKILHTPTVLDVMYDLFRKSRGDQNFHEACAKKLVGQIVMTR